MDMDKENAVLKIMVLNKAAIDKVLEVIDANFKFVVKSQIKGNDADGGFHVFVTINAFVKKKEAPSDE